MRKALLTAFLLATYAGTATASHDDVYFGVIGVYMDPAGRNCGISSSPFSLITIYVIVQPEGGVTSAKLRISETLGLLTVGTRTDYGVTSIGTFYEGIEVAWSSCSTRDRLVGTITFFRQMEPLPACEAVTVVPHPNSEIPGMVFMVDCTQPVGIATPARGGRAFSGTDPYFCGGCNDNTVATESTTWGSVKALYR